MKRNRVEEVQFRARSAHPILSAQHGPTIQYQIAAGQPIKTNVTDSPTTIGASAPTVQYTTCKSISMNPEEHESTLNNFYFSFRLSIYTIADDGRKCEN